MTKVWKQEELADKIKQKPTEDPEQKFVMVKTISSFEITYMIPLQEGQTVNDHLDYVTCQDIQEFSQAHIDESILPNCTKVMGVEEMLALFDKENDYLSSWSREKKIEWVHNQLRKLEDD